MNPIDTPSLQPKENPILSELKGFLSYNKKLVTDEKLIGKIDTYATDFCKKENIKAAEAETTLNLRSLRENAVLGIKLQYDAVKRLEVWKQQSINDQHYA
jgi:hypothetical protein